jgi:hypothetical protein
VMVMMTFITNISVRIGTGTLAIQKGSRSGGGWGDWVRSERGWDWRGQEVNGARRSVVHKLDLNAG